MWWFSKPTILINLFIIKVDNECSTNSTTNSSSNIESLTSQINLVIANDIKKQLNNSNILSGNNLIVSTNSNNYLSLSMTAYNKPIGSEREKPKSIQKQLSYKQ
jgi:hypothetical protein